MRPLLLSVKEATLLLGVGRTTLYELVRQRHVTPVKIGRAVRFPMHELEKFVSRLIDDAKADHPSSTRPHTR